jgi:hypothetical protein
MTRPPAVLEGVDAALTKLVDLFSDRSVRRPLIFAFLMMLSVTFAFWGVGTFIPTYVAGVAAKAGLSGPAWAGWAGLITACCGTVGFRDTTNRRSSTKASGRYR